METPIVDLNGSLNWNIAYKQELLAEQTEIEGEFHPIPRQNFLCPSNLLLVGCFSTKAKPTWWLGCRVSVNLSLNKPDSSSTFSGTAEIYRANVGLGQLKLLHWRAYQPKPYLIILSIPWWLEHLSVEAYWYDGDISSNYQELLGEILSRLSPPETGNYNLVL